MPTMRWPLLVGCLFCWCCSLAHAQGPVARKAEPWWLNDRPEARAARRLQDLRPEKWPAAEVERRTLHVAATMGDFEGYGKVRILDLFATAGLVNYADNPDHFQQSLYATYEVIEPADVLLRKNAGAGFWRFDNTSAASPTVFYSGETWDAREQGVFQMYDPQANGWVGAGIGPWLAWGTAYDGPGLWRVAGSPALSQALPNARLKQLGYHSLHERYLALAAE